MNMTKNISYLACINRNIVECKAARNPDVRRSSESINRNIVECKEGLRLFYVCLKIVLIETLWNVKSISIFFVSISFSVLIETLWNVKIIMSAIQNIKNIVLIETLWNVKRRSYFGVSPPQRY